MNTNILRKLSYGMYIVSSSSNGLLGGCVVNTVTQITSINPIISISINKDNHTNKLIKESKRVAISILSENTNKETITTFGFYSSKNINKFENINYEIINHLPVVMDNICGYILGEVINIIDVETHDIFLIKITYSEKLNEYEPMTYKYYQTNLKGISSKNAPTYVENQVENSKGNKYRCVICGHIYDEEIENIKFEDLPDDWVCPVCGVPKSKFEKIN